MKSLVFQFSYYQYDYCTISSIKCQGYAAGKVTKAELDMAFDEYANFMRETDKKYT